MINRNRKQLGLAAFITIIVVALFLAFTHAPESNNNVADNDSNNKRITANTPHLYKCFFVTEDRSWVYYGKNESSQTFKKQKSSQKTT